MIRAEIRHKMHSKDKFYNFTEIYVASNAVELIKMLNEPVRVGEKSIYIIEQIEEFDKPKCITRIYDEDRPEA